MIGSCCHPQSVPLCSQERRGVGDGSLRRTRSRGLLRLSSWLASSSPLCLQRCLEAPASPKCVCFEAPLSFHLFSPYNIGYSPFFHPFFVICHSTLRCLFLCVPDRQIDNGTAAQSGVRAFSYQQHAWDSLHCLACFHMMPRKLKSFAYKTFFFLLHAPFVMLFGTFS